MSYYLTTDTHFNHLYRMAMFCHRPADYETQILKGLLALKKTDVLIHLGDICIGKDEYWNSILGALPCKKWLIKGNHDRKSYQWYLDHGWDLVCETLSIEKFGKIILFSHQPRYYQQGDFGTIDNYEVNFHGHFHNTNHRSSEKDLIAVKNYRQYLISVEELNYQPLKLERAVKLFNDKLKSLNDK